MLNIFDRGSFDADLKCATSSLRDSTKRSPVGLVFVDIDHFKHVNDTHGHQVGDTVLRTVADIIQRHCPNGATPYRYGGEELAVIVRDSTLDEVTGLADTLRARIAEHAFENPEIKVTASFGVALHDEPAALLKMADTALYQAKHDGRNCVRVSRANEK